MVSKRAACLVESTKWLCSVIASSPPRSFPSAGPDVHRCRMWYATRMGRGARSGWAGMGAGLAMAAVACKSAPARTSSPVAQPRQSSAPAAPAAPLPAFAATAAGADLGLGGARLEYALRALEGPLFDSRVDAQRTVHGADLTASAVNFYEGVTLRDLQGFTEQAPLHSRLVKQGTTVVEQIYRLPAAADALERVLPSSAPPQRAVFEPLSAFFRSGDPAQFDAAARAWTAAFGLVDALAGFFDRTADPRGRKALFGAMVGIADPERTEALERLQLRNSGEALFLLSANGALRPLQTYALTLDGKSALFASALEAAAQVRADPAIAALADPQLVPELLRCAPALRFAQLALRELSREPPDALPALDEALADANASALPDA